EPAPVPASGLSSNDCHACRHQSSRSSVLPQEKRPAPWTQCVPPALGVVSPPLRLATTAIPATAASAIPVRSPAVARRRAAGVRPALWGAGRGGVGDGGGKTAGGRKGPPVVPGEGVGGFGALVPGRRGGAPPTGARRAGADGERDEPLEPTSVEREPCRCAG